jgi:hypothetical protein
MNRSIGDAVLIGGLCLFASWTVFCHVLVSTDSSFSDLMAWCFVPVVVGIVLSALCLDQPGRGDAPRAVPAASPGVARRQGANFTGLLFALAGFTLLLNILGAPYWAVWVVMVFTAGLVFHGAAVSVAGEEALPAPNWYWQRVGATGLVVAGAVLVAITHRANIDDAQYLNFVVTALDFPSEPLFSHSGLWRDQSVPLELPIYRFHAYELLSAALSQTFGVDHKIFYYMVLAPILGGVAVLVHWRLAQYLVPRHAFAFLLLWLALIIALGESNRSLGNFAFVRMFQGKGPLVTIGLPLCLLLGLRFAELPNWRRGLALALAVTASLGMSSSALATAPVLVAAALGGGLLSASRASISRILTGGVASLVLLVAVGVFLVMSMNTGHGLVPGRALPTAEGGLATLLGGGLLGAIVLSLFPIAPVFIVEERRRRLYATSTLILVVAVLNPWTSPFFAEMFDQAFQWRIFWSVPLVVSAAVALLGMAAMAAGRLPPSRRWAVLPVLMVTLVAMSSRLSISPDNAVEFAFPRYKVEPHGYAMANEIVHQAPERSTVYAPVSISAWITTFRHHPYPLIVRPDYLSFGSIRQHVGIPEIDRRKRVIKFLEGKDKRRDTASFFAAQLASDRPTMVAYERTSKAAPALANALGNAGYVGEARGNYWLWKRPLLAVETRVSACTAQDKASAQDLADCIDGSNPSVLSIL